MSSGLGKPASMPSDGMQGTKRPSDGMQGTKRQKMQFSGPFPCLSSPPTLAQALSLAIWGLPAGNWAQTLSKLTAISSQNWRVRQKQSSMRVGVGNQNFSPVLLPGLVTRSADANGSGECQAELGSINMGGKHG